jgi:hypothetical protein
VAASSRLEHCRSWLMNSGLIGAGSWYSLADDFRMISREIPEV